MNSVELAGLIGSILTSLSFAPQVVKSFISGDLSGVSVWNPVVGLLAGAFWLYYGISLGIVPVLVSTGFVGVCNLLLVGLKVRAWYGERAGREAGACSPEPTA